MLKRWKKVQISQKELDQLYQSVIKILKNSKTIVFTYQNTGSNWLGVQTATKGMFPDHCVVLPQNYSNSLLSVEQQKKLFQLLKENQTQLVIFSGIPNYVLNWIEQLSVLKMQTGIIYHGGLAELNGNMGRQQQMQTLLKMANSGVINRIGVVKKGLDDWFRSKTKAQVFRILPALNISTDLNIKKHNDGKMHIGIFGNSSYNKNRHTQVAAASMIENSIVHILAPNEFSYTLPPDRIVVHQNLSRTEFLELLGSMNINLYCSYSESWGQVVLESFALGVPCIFSMNSGLEELLGTSYLVNSYDNPGAIVAKINDAIGNPLDDPLKLADFNNDGLLSFLAI